jgi:iron donor protein CyaY
MAGLSEQEFRLRSDEALDTLRRSLLTLADDEGFEIELQNGVLELVFEEPHAAKFVVSPNTAMCQMWVAAMARSYKVPWDSERRAFALAGEPLPALLDRLAREFLRSAS